jgi:STE24 endopeptidase
VKGRAAIALLLLSAAGTAFGLARGALAQGSSSAPQAAGPGSRHPQPGDLDAPNAPAVASGGDVPTAHRGEAPASAYFDPRFLARSAEYNRTQVAYALNSRALRWALYATLLFSPFVARATARLERRWPGRPGLHAAVVSASVLLLAFLVLLPISFASGFLMEHRYGLSRQSAASWFGDVAKSLLLSGTLTCALTVLYFALRRRLPRGGWAAFAAVAVAAMAALVFVVPVVVDPLFYRFRPLADPVLRRDLVDMAAREGVRVDGALVMEASAKTVRENAYFTGLGATKRVVLYDNLLAHASPAEVRQVVAHELGHWSRGHIVRGMAIGAVAIPLAAWLLWTLHGRLARSPRLHLRGPADPAGVPLVWLLLSLGIFLTDPIHDAISRSFEREADRVSLELTRDPDTFIEGERRMAVNNLTWVDPPPVIRFLFWTHPTTLERIRMAEAWREGKAR